MVRKGEASDLIAGYGQLIVDEREVPHRSLHLTVAAAGVRSILRAAVCAVEAFPIGIATGVAVDAMSDNIAIEVAIGVVFGTALGTFKRQDR